MLFDIMVHSHPNLPLGLKYNYYRADEKYAELARLLGLPADTIQQGVESYAQACHNLALECGIKMSFSEQGISEETFNQDMEMISFLAFEDQCTPCNPRLALVKDMQEILKKAYKSA